MRNLLKYILPIVIAVAFSNATGGFESSSRTAVSYSGTIKNVKFSEFISTPYSQLDIPRQVSLSFPIRVQSCARRPVSVHRPVFEFVKSGKALNTSVLYSVQRQSVILNTSVIEHAHKLVYLGKLII
ncbi:MAG: hypothetical protein IJN02_11290 [Bacteroidales bacterium]|nr:hypothetical protein [Bacteroidales bacterium]